MKLSIVELLEVFEKGGIVVLRAIRADTEFAPSAAVHVETLAERRYGLACVELQAVVAANGVNATTFAGQALSYMVHCTVLGSYTG